MRSILRKFWRGLQFIFVELPKFQAKNIQDKKLQVLWFRYLTEIKDQTEEISEDLLAVPEIREAVELLQESAFSKEELATYDKYWDSIASEITLINEAEQRGKQEQMLHTARKMKAKGFSLDEIAELTGLSQETIETL